jgi:hypothetical protein
MGKKYIIASRDTFLEAIVLYNLVVYTTFVAIYNNIDFEKHFQITNGAKPTPAFFMYFAFMTHSNAMCSEVEPRTEFGRTLLGLNVFCSWILFLTLLAPWTAVRLSTPLLA